MPQRPYWYRNIPGILHWLEAISDPFIDRYGIEMIFHISEREAQRILRRVGPLRIRNVHVVSRWRLIEWVRKVSRDNPAALELQRVERLEDKLEKYRTEMIGRHVNIHADPGVQEIADLPTGVHLQAGELRIEFFGTEDLLRHLFELAQVITHDYVRIQKLLEE